jgi:hypothetical protein
MKGKEKRKGQKKRITVTYNTRLLGGLGEKKILSGEQLLLIFHSTSDIYCPKIKITKFAVYPKNNC